MHGLRLETFTGADRQRWLPALGALRISVFRAWPYLYDGSLAHEEGYQAEFRAARDAALVVAFDGEAAVGCSTCMPLMEEEAALLAPFRAAGIDPARVCYFGESVLLPAYRGRGVGVGFFMARETHARSVAGVDFAAFCAVVRPEVHPLRPAGSVPLDAFWRRRGFTPYPSLVARLSWKQVDSDGAVENRLSFWLKSLTGAALP